MAMVQKGLSGKGKRKWREGENEMSLASPLRSTALLFWSPIYNI